ncbi:MAG: phosphomethylpyrimidine synthase ThiC, partial [Elusimicrobiota bacterium]
KIKENIFKEKKICNGAPFYVLGPLTTDIGAGYDHITSAIGGALAGYMGADFLCYVTPAEHMHLPGLKDVKEGVIASKIAAHSADLARGRSDYRDRKMSEARRRLDWKEMEKYALDPEKIREARKKYPSLKENACTMCGSYCALADEEI